LTDPAKANHRPQPIIESIEEIPDDTATSPPGGPLQNTLSVAAQVTFPDASVFGIKLVNGKPTTALLNFLNGEEDPVTVRMIGGSLWPPSALDIKESQAIRNLSSTLFSTVIPPNTNQTLQYQFTTELHPQDLRLLLAAIVEDSKGHTFQIESFNGTVSVVEAPISIFDPQMYVSSVVPRSKSH